MISDVWCPNENDVISAVMEKLQEMGFVIESNCNTSEHGIDIVGSKNKLKIFIEAKGGTTSKDSNRKGKPFTRNQAYTHISVALFTAMKYLTQTKEQDNVIIGIALPYEKNHLHFINLVNHALDKLNIVTFWVKEKEVIIRASDSVIELLKQ